MMIVTAAMPAATELENLLLIARLPPAFFIPEEKVEVAGPTGMNLRTFPAGGIRLPEFN
jgi:hypothetical protein